MCRHMPVLPPPYSGVPWFRYVKYQSGWFSLLENDWIFPIILMHLLIGMGLYSATPSHHTRMTLTSFGIFPFLMPSQVLCCMWFMQGHYILYLWSLWPLLNNVQLIHLYVSHHLILSCLERLRSLIPRIAQTSFVWVCMFHSTWFCFTLSKYGPARPVLVCFTVAQSIPAVAAQHLFVSLGLMLTVLLRYWLALLIIPIPIHLSPGQLLWPRKHVIAEDGILP